MNQSDFDTPVGMRALERGLNVIKYFTDRESPATISDIARGTGLDRAVVRRVLATLERLSYVARDGAGFVLQPAVLELGYAYLSSDPLPAIADAHLGPLSEALQESCSLGVLRGLTRVVYLSTKQFRRVAGPTLTVGTFAEPQQTSIGRILLAALSEENLDRALEGLVFEARTPHTITDRQTFVAELGRIRDQGWCLVDQEAELGLLALAVPVRAPSGKVIAGVNVTTHTSRSEVADFISSTLPQLLTIAGRIEKDLLHIRSH
ncbi:transcriptional regulator, IclR family protein [Mycolicibacterium smegmatis MKD8]|uniref:Transcriptional regulator, IclR family protein n=2 Tax=Mycolicibacterium smegmatis TaxID=1772 RepID=A0A2U9PIN6_MYCSE|nr:transcriptional regulator, IclR family protein [Mycolicibacterium smegmatis MKD8]